MASELLASDGHRPLTASSGRDGLAQAQAERPDLVLLDYHMPDMDGLAVIEKLRADPTTRRIPVVALTSATAEHANALVRAGCIGFIPKPFAPTEFLRLIVEFLHVTVARSRHDPGR
jgi:CheY-like chemotaxis protein